MADGVLYPIGYGKRMVTMSQMRAEFENDMEPEYAHRFFNFIESEGGALGPGGGVRDVQPDKPGFAPADKSFHLRQKFADGTTWYCAIDLVHVNPGKVHRAPTWSEVPRQGSAAAARWGVHCNVDQGATPEPWHMQAIEMDGFDTWIKAGRPRPKAGYPIPDLHPDTPIPIDPQGDDDVEKILVRHVNGQMYLTDLTSYAAPVSEDQGARQRDMRGAKVGPDSGPFPLDQLDSDFVAELAHH